MSKWESKTTNLYKRTTPQEQVAIASAEFGGEAGLESEPNLREDLGHWIRLNGLPEDTDRELGLKTGEQNWVDSIDEANNLTRSPGCREEECRLTSEGEDFTLSEHEHSEAQIPVKPVKQKGKKKYGSLRSLQDRVLSEADRKKRDRALRKLKRKGWEENAYGEIDEASLSSSDLRGRWKLMTRDATELLNFARKVGFHIEGDTNEAISELARVWVLMLVRSHRADMIFIQESKLDTFSLAEAKKLWGDDDVDFLVSPAEGRSGGLLTLWDKKLFCASSSVCEKRYIAVKGKWINVDMESCMVNVYAPNAEAGQIIFWAELTSLKLKWNSSWVAGGDFNTVISRSERSGCKYPSKGVSEFNNFITNCCLIDLPLGGKNLLGLETQINEVRLDRFLVDESWCLKFNDLMQSGLKRSISDHIPILLSTGEWDWGPRPFKFINAWLEKEDCRQVVDEVWAKNRNSKLGIAFKLKIAKMALKQWSFHSCGDFDKKVEELERKIEIFDSRGENAALSATELEELKECQYELWDVMKHRESLWRQKSRITWLKEGDSNTAFFHRVTKIRAKRRGIFGLNSNDGWKSVPARLKRYVYEFFRDHFSCIERKWKAKLRVDVKRLSVEEARKIQQPFNVEEIKEAIWSCEDSKAPGPDGFNFFFFKRCWDTVKEDLTTMMADFYYSEKLPSKINSTFIALIPKVANPVELSDFRPISLVSSAYKIIAKILARRLSAVVEHVVSETQSAFIKGRQIFDGMFLLLLLCALSSRGGALCVGIKMFLLLLLCALSSRGGALCVGIKMFLLLLLCALSSRGGALCVGIKMFLLLLLCALSSRGGALCVGIKMFLLLLLCALSSRGGVLW
ncbi:hypothetical protein GQ457_14G009450 [Hibiscus cannabinus]